MGEAIREHGSMVRSLTIVLVQVSLNPDLQIEPLGRHLRQLAARSQHHQLVQPGEQQRTDGWIDFHGETGAITSGTRRLQYVAGRRISKGILHCQRSWTFDSHRYGNIPAQLDRLWHRGGYCQARRFAKAENFDGEGIAFRPEGIELRQRQRQATGEWTPERDDYTWLETAFCEEFLKPLSWFGGLEHEWRIGPKGNQAGFLVLLWSKDPRRLWWQLRDELERQAQEPFPGKRRKVKGQSPRAGRRDGDLRLL